jgi:hypothetical protein
MNHTQSHPNLSQTHNTSHGHTCETHVSLAVRNQIAPETISVTLLSLPGTTVMSPLPPPPLPAPVD